MTAINPFHFSENDLTGVIISCAIEVHKQLGPGLLESVYRESLRYELMKKRLEVAFEKAMPVIYKEIQLDHGYRMDLVINKIVVVEIKTVDAFTEVHLAQVLTYLKFGKYRLGPHLNFNVTTLKKGIRRVIL